MRSRASLRPMPCASHYSRAPSSQTLACIQKFLTDTGKCFHRRPLSASPLYPPHCPATQDSAPLHCVHTASLRILPFRSHPPPPPLALSHSRHLPFPPATCQPVTKWASEFSGGWIRSQANKVENRRLQQADAPLAASRGCPRRNEMARTTFMESASAWSQCPTVVSNDPVKSFRSSIPFPSPAMPPLPSAPPLVEADDMHMHCTEPECMSGSTLTTFGPYPDSLRGFRTEDSGGRYFHIAMKSEGNGE
jgi:hypothetical protein